jgi:broad specificity phosphatase PhoE
MTASAALNDSATFNNNKHGNTVGVGSGSSCTVDVEEHSIGDSSNSISGPSQSQSMFVIRHGDRWDYSHPEWKQNNPKRPGDPSLSDLGFQQARETGQFLAKLFLESQDNQKDNSEQFDVSQLVVLSSPFLRTVQTANEIVGELEKHFPSSSSQSSTNTTSIKLECAVWEIDGHDGINHRSLPSPNGRDTSVIIEERHPYFPRVDRSYESLFTPALPGKSICQ